MAIERENGASHALPGERLVEAHARGDGGPTLRATNPATGQFIGHVDVTPVDAVPQLYAQARAAQKVWGALLLRDRVRHLRRLRLVVVDQLEDIARRVAESTGKTETEALTTELLLVLGALQFVEQYTPRVLRRRRKPTPIFLAGKHSFIEYMPKGVVLVIAPWNFPLQLALVPVMYAIAAGNAVILKPSEVTPLVGVLIEELIEQARFPAHVVQVAHGAGELGAALVTPPRVAGRPADRRSDVSPDRPADRRSDVSPDRPADRPDGVPDAGPDHIFFTGSVGTGKIIQAEAAKRLIPTTLELSGKDAMIVFADAPIERAVNGAVWGAFMNCGQVCVSVERLYVERGIHDEFVRRMADESVRLRQRRPQDAAHSDSVADLGSMTFAPQVDIVRQHVTDALERGATLLHGSRPDNRPGDRPGDRPDIRPDNLSDNRPDDGPDKWNGMFIPPVILGNVTPDMRVAQEETFGPIVTVIPFDSEQEAIEAVNASEYGLNASVWSRDAERAHRVASKIKAGSVAINDIIVTLANQHIPFGGVKQSGLGSNHGETGLKTFSHEKAIMRDWLGRKRDVHWFPYEGKAPLFAQLLRSYFRARTNWAGFLSAFIGLLRRSR